MELPGKKSESIPNYKAEWMEESQKYYTPTVDEFHDSFEYEIRSKFKRGLSESQAGEFTLTTFSLLHDSVRVFDAISSSYDNFSFIRVPYLSCEDIESQGFKIDNITKERQICASKGMVIRGENAIINIIYNTFSKWLLVTNYLHIWPEQRTVFAGTIKNKSEFKKILKSIGA